MFAGEHGWRFLVYMKHIFRSMDVYIFAERTAQAVLSI